MSVNPPETGETKRPGNPPEPPRTPKPFTREEDYSPEEVQDAVLFLGAVPPAVAPDPAIDAALKAIFCFYKNAAGDRNLARGRNWDGSSIYADPPRCPDWQKCSRPQSHWGDCTPYAPYRGHNNWQWPVVAPTVAVRPKAIGLVDNKLLGASEGKHYLPFSKVVSYNGVAHGGDCTCDGEPGCADVRLSEMAGVRSEHADATIGESVISTCTDETKAHFKNLVAFYLFRCKDGHRWAQRIVDSRHCPSPDCKAAFKDMTQIRESNDNIMVAAYKMARASKFRTGE